MQGRSEFQFCFLNGKWRRTDEEREALETPCSETGDDMEAVLINNLDRTSHCLNCARKQLNLILPPLAQLDQQLTRM
jgi:hypothetical protein